jgi:hypothetical protein
VNQTTLQPVLLAFFSVLFSNSLVLSVRRHVITGTNSAETFQGSVPANPETFFPTLGLLNDTSVAQII